MKLVVVGCVTGGASAATRVRRLDPKAEIVVFERGEHVSYSNCCLPYYLGGVVPDAQSLLLMTPQAFKARFDIDVRTKSKVTGIDRERKVVLVHDLASDETYEEPFDRLVLSPDAAPLRPRSIRGIDRENVLTLRNVVDIEAIKAASGAAASVVVVGGGFVGIEVAENLAMAGRQVTLVEALDQVMAPFDEDMVQILHKELVDNGVRLMLSTRLLAVEDGQVLVEAAGGERAVPADVVIMAAGVRPETELATAAGLDIGSTGGIAVNEHFQTSDPDIYAVGDAIELTNALTGKPGRLALAGPAQRQARSAANHICGVDDPFAGSFIGSSCIKVFGQNAARTGLSEREAKAAGISCDSVTVLPPDHVGVYPGSHYLVFKLIFETPTGRILGAQAIGRGEAVKRVDVIAAMVSQGATLTDLKDLELCYAPPFSTAKDVVNQAALVAENVRTGTVKQVHVSEVRRLVESGAYIVDVREPGEYGRGHLNGSHNVPLSQLRERANEIPRDVPVYLHCRSSQRSYYAICYLQGMGWDNVVNISGSFLGISLYEWFRDQSEGRKPIMDRYNFN